MSVARTAVCTVLAVAVLLCGCSGATGGRTTPQRTPAGPSPTAAASSARDRGASPDFDGDGWADLAVGIGRDEAELEVHYGDGHSQVIDRPLLDRAHSLRFASSLLAHDLNGDGYTDLVVGSPQDSVSEGAMFLLFGSPSGLATDTAAEVPVSASRLALVASPEPVLAVATHGADTSATTLLVLFRLGPDGLPLGKPATVDLDRPGAAGAGIGALAASGSLLVVGQPEAEVGGVRLAGTITALRFTAATDFTRRTYSQASPGVPGAVGEFHRFGAAVAAGDGWVVVGVPGEADGRVLPFRIGGRGRLRAAAVLRQGRAGVPGKPERSDGFGSAVAMLRPCAGVPGVVVGAPQESIETMPNDEGDRAGSVWVIPLADGCAPPRQVFDWGSGLDTAPARDVQLGQSVSALRAGSDRADTMVAVASGSFDDHVLGRVIELTLPVFSSATAVIDQIRLSEGGQVGLSPLAG